MLNSTGRNGIFYLYAFFPEKDFSMGRFNYMVTLRFYKNLRVIGHLLFRRQCLQENSSLTLIPNGINLLIKVDFDELFKIRKV
jgi:hypothetical protein